jgi:XTP/dITP diphosphohydrolase
MPAARLDESLSFEPSASRPNHLPLSPGRLTFGSPPAASSPGRYTTATRLLIATTNRHKVREIRALLAGIPYDIVSLDDWPDIEAPEEAGRMFEDNARAKALYYAGATGELTIAEDSGLEIDALGGAPGVESARYGGIETSYPQKFALIYAALRQKNLVDSTARFVCAVALARTDRIIFQTRGVIEGRIAAAPRGEGGFGYDPIFFYPPYGRTLAEATPDQKSAVSHRGQAFRTLRRFLEGWRS